MGERIAAFFLWGGGMTYNKKSLWNGNHGLEIWDASPLKATVEFYPRGGQNLLAQAGKVFDLTITSEANELNSRNYADQVEFTGLTLAELLAMRESIDQALAKHEEHQQPQ